MKRISALILALTILASPAAFAGQTPKAVIELFTSQGCSSCPPADARLTEFSRDPDVVALTLHVDYWDYLGWKDTLAKPAFSERQRAYAEGRGDRGVFTPQMVINGGYACAGANEGDIALSLGKATREHAHLPVAIAVEREGAVISVEITDDVAGSGEVWLLSVQSSETVAIERGENKGREATYVNVVRAITPIGTWSGGRAKFEAAATGPGDSFVVLLHEASENSPGRIIGAAKGPNL
jgi:hypothetical protein